MPEPAPTAETRVEWAEMLSRWLRRHWGHALLADFDVVPDVFRLDCEDCVANIQVKWADLLGDG